MVADARPPSRADRVFLTLWALLTATAFLSILAQMKGTFGSGGLMPLVKTASLPLWVYPTVLHVLPYDAVAWCLLLVGLAACLAAAANIRPGLSFAVAAVCWVQVSQASPTLLGLPPDFIVFHVTIAAALMANRDTRDLGLVFARLVLAKLYLEAGLAKLAYPGAGGVQEWLQGGFPASFFLVVPVPGLAARFWHNALQAEVQSAFAGLVAVGQVVCGLATFGPLPARIAAFVFLSGFQLFLISAGNFGALCWGSLLLGGVLLLDLRGGLIGVLRTVVSARGVSAPTVFGRVFTALWIAAQVAQMGADAAQIGEHHPARAMVQGWRLANRYSMFLVVPRRRVEWHYQEVLADGSAGPVLLLPWQLDLERTSGLALFTFHPRFTFLLWFQSTVQEQSDWGRVLDHAAQNQPDEQVVPMVRWFGALQCARHLSPDRQIRLSAVEVRYAPVESEVWWTSRALAMSAPMSCADLIDTAAPPWELIKENMAWGR